jgi:hypothetical protein
MNIMLRFAPQNDKLVERVNIGKTGRGLNIKGLVFNI